MTDLNFVSAEGLAVECHGAMLACLGPFVTSMLEGSQGDQILLPDFTMEEICALLHLLYTGK